MKKSLLGVRLRTRVQRDVVEGATGGGAESDAGASTDDDTGTGDDDDEGGDDGSGDDDSSSEKTVSEAKYLQIKAQLQASDRKKQAALDELNRLKTKDMPEAERAATELKEAREQAAAYKDRFEKTARTNAFLTASSELKVVWVNADTALRLAELDELEINDDGSVDGIKDAVKALVKDHPYLLAPKDSEDTNGKEKGPTKSGSVVGSKNQGKKPEGEISKEDLLKRFPNLAR